MFVYWAAENVTLSPFFPVVAEMSHQSDFPLTSQLSELVTVMVWSPPSAPNVSSVGSMLIEYSFFSCVTVKVAFLSPLMKVNVALLLDSESSFGSAEKRISAFPFPE